MKILVCEDDFMVNKTLEHKLKLEGYEVTCAFDGKQAEDLLSEFDYDIILTDLLMPYVSGLELINYARVTLNKSVPIIVLSNIGLENTVLQAFELGADDYITKPFSPNELLIRIKKQLRKLR